MGLVVWCTHGPRSWEIHVEFNAPWPSLDEPQGQGTSQFYMDDNFQISYIIAQKMHENYLLVPMIFFWDGQFSGLGFEETRLWRFERCHAASDAGMAC